jgi:lysophospholipase L1-like esterase
LILQPALFRIVRSGLAGLAILLAPAPGHTIQAAEEPKRWDLENGDRIVLVGDTLIERDQRYGYLETFLTIANPELNLTFRNLGWSGDTVRGLSRAGFDPPEAGFRALKEQILAVKPTVLIVGYGMADSFDGEAGLPKFVSGLNELLDAVSITKARLVLLSPIAHEDLGRPLPDPASHNRDLERYTDAIRKVAGERNARFVELLDWFPIKAKEWHHTDDGIHLNEDGYHMLAHAVCFRLGQDKTMGMTGRSEIRGDGEVIDAFERKVSDVKVTSSGLRFVVQNKALPTPSGPEMRRQREQHTTPGLKYGLSSTLLRHVRFSGLAPDPYLLKIDGKNMVKASAADWAKGIDLWAGPDRDQVELLRKTINAKNRLFFHRWRPQNITYLFGFRKHEQGNNAIEIPKFDPLVEAKEREIARLKKPVPHVYELVRESEVAK